MKKRIVLYFSYIACFVLAFSIIIRADESINPDAEDEVVVTATRTPEAETQSPGKSEVITKEEIEDSGATTVADALTDNGNTISAYGGMAGQATIQLDGSKDEQTLVLVNGVPVNAGMGGFVDVSYFPTASIERIEVVHGPLSALYGSSAIGGVVNIITDLTGEPRNEVGLSGGSFNTKSLDMKFQQEKWGFALGLKATDGYRLHSGTDYHYLMGQYNFLETDDQYLKLYWQYLNKNGQEPGRANSPSDATQLKQDLSISLAGGTGFLDGFWEYKAYAQYFDQHHDSATLSRHQSHNYGLDMAGQYALANHELLFGMMLRQERLDSTNFGQRFRNDDGLFIQDNWRFNDRLKLVIGLRQDFYTEFASPLTPRICLVDSLTDQVILKAGYGQTFRAPTFSDLYWYETGEYNYYGNPNLKPEKGERYDLIGEWKKDRRSVTVDIFQSNIWDGITWQAMDSTYMNWQVVNIAKMRIQGISFAWENVWLDEFSTTIGYTMIDKKGYDSVSGQYNKDYNDLGKQKLNLSLGLKLEKWRGSLNWYFIYDRNNNMPNYNILNLNLKYLPKKSLSFALAVENLGDQDYQVVKNYPMPGRCYTFSTNYSF